MKTPDQVLGFIVDHPLMHWIVQPKYGKPIFHLPGEELQRMDIDVVGNSLVFLAGSSKCTYIYVDSIYLGIMYLKSL